MEKNAHKANRIAAQKYSSSERKKKKQQTFLCEAHNGLHWSICILHTHEMLCKQTNTEANEAQNNEKKKQIRVMQ